MTIENTKSSATINRCQELAALITGHTNSKGDGAHNTAIAKLEFIRESSVPARICDVFEPILGIIVQGKKETLLGEQTYRHSAAQYIVISVNLPLSASVIEATPQKPYLGFKLNLDSTELCDIVSQIPFNCDRKERSVRGVFVSDANESLINCAIRLTQLLDTPQDIPFLAPIIIREIYYRLLIGEQGEAVRQIATSGSNMQRIARAIRKIEAYFKDPIQIEDLAKQTNMSPSSFHRHFKAVTSMSPLQYQKQIRLLEARRLLIDKDINATHAAYQVGYESPSQFSREYSRMFGSPPMRDIKRLRGKYSGECDC